MRILLILAVGLAVHSASAMLVEPSVVNAQLASAPWVVDLNVSEVRTLPDATYHAVSHATAHVDAVYRTHSHGEGPAAGDSIEIVGVGGEVDGVGVMYSGLPRPYVGGRYRAYLTKRADGTFAVTGYDQGLRSLVPPAAGRTIWTRNRTDGSNGDGTGPFLYWDPSYFPIAYFVSLPSFTTHSDFPAAIDESFRAWRNVDDIKVEFVGLGCTKGAVNQNEGVNSVIYIENGWPFDAGAIAITRNFYIAGNNPRAGLILDSDIMLNAEDHEFTTRNEIGKHDIQNIVTHEAGHFLGLGHEVDPGADSDATMFPTAAPNETKKRTLKLHDLQAISSGYSGVGVKSGFQHVSCAVPDSLSCATVHRPATPATVGWSLAFIFGLALIPALFRQRAQRPRGNTP